MPMTRTPSALGRRDIGNATRFYGNGTGRWLAARERHQAAIANAAQTRLLKQAGVSVSSPSVVGRLRDISGAVFVRIGLRLKAAAGQPARATSR